MSIYAVEGAAGYGKTYRLFEVLKEELAARPLAQGARVLALTFMHGSRRRLQGRLAAIPELRGRFECWTIDSFAWRLCRRWRSLRHELGHGQAEDGSFDAQCDTAGALLEQQPVRQWVAASFPVILIDEAQDLRPQRMRMVRALEPVVRLLVAGDDFQCLDATLLPNPFIAWLRASTTPEVLVRSRRTEVSALLAASTALRNGAPPVQRGSFRIVAPPGLYPAAACLANAIAWSGGGTVAVITPSMQGGFAADVVGRVCSSACGKDKHGPYPITWERSDHDEADDLVAQLNLPDAVNLYACLETLHSVKNPLASRVADWVLNRHRVLGVSRFSRQEIEGEVCRQLALRRHWSGPSHSRLAAMTVHQAKNREFQCVVVIWPYRVAGDQTQKRRLLYNAVTRARCRCTVIAQNESILNRPPFS